MLSKVSKILAQRRTLACFPAARRMLFRVPPLGRTPHALPSPAARPPVHAACSSESLIPAAHRRTTHALSSPDSRPHAACSPKTRLPAAGARCMLFQVPPSGHTPHALQSPASRPHAACSPESRFSAARRMLSRVPPPGRRRTPPALPSPTSGAHAVWFFRVPPPGPSPGNRRTASLGSACGVLPGSGTR